MKTSIKIVCALVCILSVSGLFARSVSRTSEIPAQYFSTDRAGSYTPALRQGGVLFVEDICGTFGPGTSPDPLWQGVLDSILGVGNYGWYTTMSAGDNGPDSVEMMNYDLVIWNCYDYWWQDTAAFTVTDEINMQTYFYNGGAVWAIGQDLLWSYNGNWTFMQTYFHLQTATEDYYWDEPDVNLHGLVELDSISFLATSDYTSNNFFTDALVPDANAHVVLEDTDMSQDVGIFYPGQGDWMAAFWSIDGRNPNPYNEWVTMVTQMLAAFGITGIKETPGNEVARRLYLNISPDPVVHQTTLTYNLPTNGHVTLAIYNRTGQHVITLVDGYQTAGSYDVVWTAQDAQGSAVSNGVYFGRLECGESVGSASLVVVH